jgi:hypothetical protein
MVKRVGDVKGDNNQKRGKSNDENTCSVIEGEEEYGMENDRSDDKLVVPVVITKQDNYKEPCLC